MLACRHAVRARNPVPTGGGAQGPGPQTASGRKPVGLAGVRLGGRPRQIRRRRKGAEAGRQGQKRMAIMQAGCLHAYTQWREAYNETGSRNHACMQTRMHANTHGCRRLDSSCPRVSAILKRSSCKLRVCRTPAFTWLFHASDQPENGEGHDPNRRGPPRWDRLGPDMKGCSNPLVVSVG